MTLDAARRGFVERIFELASNRWIIIRHFGVPVDPITPEEILGIMEEFGLSEWRDVDPASNEYGAPRLPFLLRSRPIEDVKEERREKIRRAIERIEAERREESEENEVEK